MQTCHHHKQPSEISSNSSATSSKQNSKPYTTLLRGNNHSVSNGVHPSNSEPLRVVGNHLYQNQGIPLNETIQEDPEDRKDSGCGSELDDDTVVTSSQHGSVTSRLREDKKKVLPTYEMMTVQRRKEFEDCCAL